MKYKVFIPSAGIGSRLGDLTKDMNKALLKVAGKEVITYIIDKFPEDVEIVLGLGFKGKEIREFLENYYPKRKFIFVTVDNFDGPGSGLGYTMSCCKEHLQCPFIFISNDTILLEKIPAPDHNYSGYGTERDLAQFRSLRIDGHQVTELCEKGATGKARPYIGLSGIQDYKKFWEVLDKNKAEFMKIGESAGIKYMLANNIYIEGIEFPNWLDTGNPKDLAITEEILRKINDKGDEKIDISKYVKERDTCPLCLSKNLSEGLAPHINLKFPMLPVCVETPQNEDFLIPFTICMCKQCGLIMLKTIVDPEVLYKIFHSDGIGKIWDDHYNQFAELIKQYHKTGRILEIGAGQGKLIKKMIQYYSSGVEVMDPLYEGPRENIVVHPFLFEKETAERLQGQFDSIVSSHTLEHFVEFKEYFENSWKALKPGGFLFTSIPNQESNFAKGYGNQLNFEHTSICTNLHWMYLHYKYGFVIRKISLYLDHSIQIAAQKVEKPVDYDIDIKTFSEKLLEQYARSIKERMDKIKQFAKPDKENWIYGASNFTQPLFVYGLEEGYFKGILDSSPLKHNKRMYGTSLICRNPDEIIPQNNNLRVFLNIGQYNKEVFEKFHAINPSAEFIFL